MPDLRSPIVLHIVDDPERMELIFQIRDEVFVDEQSLTDDARHDPDDDVSTHILAVRDGRPVGVGRLTMIGPEGQIAWVAVRAADRGTGIGQAIMGVLIDRARQEDAAYVMLNAQTHAITFYEQLGFEALGSVFTMGGIPHRVMVLRF